MLTDQLINILACPQCKGPLTKESQGLCCPDCRLAYPIENDVPILLVEKAAPLDQEKID